MFFASLLILASGSSAEAANATELSEVERVANLDNAAMLECIREKSVGIDDGSESAVVISHAAATLCSDIHQKAIKLATWEYMLRHNFSVQDAMPLAIELQNGIVKGFEDIVAAEILVRRSRTRNAPNQ